MSCNGTQNTMNNIFDYNTYYNTMKDVFIEHRNDIAIKCLMDNGSIWKISYGMLLRYVDDFKDIRDYLGLKEGDRVLVLSNSTTEAFITFLVVSMNQLTAVMADAAIPDGELMPLITHCQVSAIFTDLKNSGKMISSQKAPILSTYSYYSCADILAERKEPTDIGVPTPNSPAILFSSGTTAKRKCIELSYDSFIITHKKMKSLGVLYEGIPGRPMFEVFPMSHVSGLCSAFTLLYEGLSIATVETLTADSITAGFKAFKPMAFGMVPKVHDMFIKKFEDEIRKKHLGKIYNYLSEKSAESIKTTGSLKKSRKLMCIFRSLLYNENFHCVFSGGSPGTPHTAQVLFNLGIEYLDLYASTECGVYIAVTDPSYYNNIGTVGNIFNDSFCDVIIHDPDSNGIGEIYVRTKQIMNGYFRDEEETVNSFDGRYFKTGDVGRIDNKGYLYITGRAKEIILLPNGTKVAPVDLEYLLKPVFNNNLPLEVNYAIVGVTSNEDMTDEIHLFIERNDLDSSILEHLKDELLKYQKKNFSQYKLSGIHFIDEIPVTNVRKPKRYLLKEMLPFINDAEFDVQHVPEISTDLKSINQTSDTLNVESAVFETLKQITDPALNISKNDNIRDDLGLDSLDIMQICSIIESEFSVSLASNMDSIITVGDIIDYITNPASSETGSNSKKKVDIYSFPVQRKWYHKLIFKWLKKWVKSNINLVVKGEENIDPNKQYIFCPNHQTHFDGLFVWIALGDKCPDINQFGCMSKAEHRNNPITSLFMEVLGGIPVERTGNTIESTKRSISFIKEGNSFLIHPEGTRTRNGELGTFKDGAARIAIDTGLTIIPVAIDGGYDIWPYNKLFPSTKIKGKQRTLSITFCKEVNTSFRNKKNITDDIRNKISEELN